MAFCVMYVLSGASAPGGSEKLAWEIIKHYFEVEGPESAYKELFDPVILSLGSRAELKPPRAPHYLDDLLSDRDRA